MPLFRQPPQPQQRRPMAPPAVAPTRSLAGDQPAATGVLTRLLAALRALAGAWPNATGVLTRIKAAPRSLTGAMPNATGALTYGRAYARSLAGAMPNATGVLSRVKGGVRALAGNWPNATGTLTRIYKALRALAGNQPNATGTLTRAKGGVRSLAGSWPAASGALAAHKSTTYYVSPTGSDSDPGTEALPFATLRHVGDVVDAGDTVIFEDGTYNEASVRPSETLRAGGTAAARVTLKARNARQAIINFPASASDGQKMMLMTTKYVTIEGLYFTQVTLGTNFNDVLGRIWYDPAGGTADGGATPLYRADYCIIRNCVFDGAYEPFKTSEAFDPIIEDCEFTNGYVFLGSVGGVRPIIRRNLFHNWLVGAAFALGIQTKGNTYSGQIYDNTFVVHTGDTVAVPIVVGGATGLAAELNVQEYESERTVCANNLIYTEGTGTITYAGIADQGGHACLITNNVVIGASTGFRVMNGNDWTGRTTDGSINVKCNAPTFQNNILINIGQDFRYRNDATDLTGTLTWRNNLYFNVTTVVQSAAVTGDPLLANAAAGDVRLLGGSPALNAGFTTATWPDSYGGTTDTTLDRAGATRTSAYSIGAYEFALFLVALAGNQPTATGTLTAVAGVQSRSLTGNQPNATGVLTRIYKALRALTGAMPNATGTLTRIKAAPRSLAGAQPNATGTLVRVYAALRALTGAMPNATGVLARVKGGVRALAGDWPAASGVLSRIKGGVRSLAGAMPNATGALTRVLAALRALVGDWPAASGALVRSKANARSLTGTWPNATGTLVGQISVSRSLAGNMPAATGTLTRVLGAVRALIGSMPNATGALTRIYKALRSLTGSQPNATGALSASGVGSRSMAGDWPPATGVLTRIYKALRAVAGSMPNATGTLTRVQARTRSLTGTWPNATGTLVGQISVSRSLAGTWPNATGVLTRATGRVRALTGNMPTATGTLARKLAALRVLTGAMPNATGTLTGQATHAVALGGNQPAAVGALTRSAVVTRSLTGNQPAATGALTYYLGLPPDHRGTFALTDAALASFLLGQLERGGMDTDVTERGSMELVEA